MDACEKKVSNNSATFFKAPKGREISKGLFNPFAPISNNRPHISNKATTGASYTQGAKNEKS